MRLLTYNIHKGIGGRDRRYDFQRILERDRGGESRSDLPAGSRPQRPPLALSRPAATAWRSHFNAVARLRQTTVRLKTGGYGNLILSRWPFRLGPSDFVATGPQETARAQIGGRRDARGTDAAGALAPGTGREGAALAGQPPAHASPVSRSRRAADAGRGRLQRLAQHAGRRAVRPARIRATSPRRSRASARSRPTCRWARSTRRLPAATSSCAVPASCAASWPAARATTCRW